MNGRTVIAIDAVSGDHGLQETIPAALATLSKFDDLDLILVGDEQVLGVQLESNKVSFSEPRLRVVHASQVVTMDEEPARALRGKRDSSMRVAINLVKDEQADACVSAGNTGALMAISRYVLSTLAGIERPAITAMLPTLKGHIHMLDLGANVDCKAEHLFQFAVMGSVLSEVVDNVTNPKVALLNIGQETIKGNDQVKSANAQLSNGILNYIGYIEGNQLYEGIADVVVTDGFVGNVALKSIEGTASFISTLLKQTFRESYLGRITGFLASPVLGKVSRMIEPWQYNGATLLGLQGVVIKSHGYAGSRAFARAIEIARIEALKQVPKLIDKQLEGMLKA